MNFRFLVIFLIILFINNCNPVPEFSRDNPYDRDPTEDTLGINKFPPSNDRYKFTNNGLRLLVYFSGSFGSIFEGKMLIERKNGSSEFQRIDNQFITIKNRYYTDKSIYESSDIGFPLVYRFTRIDSQGNLTTYSRETVIEFGTINSISFTDIGNNEFRIDWNDDVYLNEGVILTQTTSTNTFSFEIALPDSSYTFSNANNELSDSYSITPYKFYDGQNTFLDTLEFNYNPPKSN